MDTSVIFGLSAVLLFCLGLRGAMLHRSPLGKLLSINVCGAGVFLLMVTLAYQTMQIPVEGEEAKPDALLHALVLTGIVVAVSATALGLAILRRLQCRGASDSEGAIDNE